MKPRRPRRRFLVLAAVLFGLVVVLLLSRPSPMTRFFQIVEPGMDYDDVIKLLGEPANSRSVLGRVLYDTAFSPGSAVPAWADQQVVERKYPVKEYKVYSWTADLWFSTEHITVIMDDRKVVCHQYATVELGYWGRVRMAIANLF